MHGFSSSPQKSLAINRPLAEAGFIVPAPHFSNLSGRDVHNGNQSKDISEVITRTLAPNTAGAPPAGHINAAVGLGASGHSMGGMTTHGLRTSCPDARITAAIPMSCGDMGNASPAVRAKVLFTHGDRDGTCPISSARLAYRELPVAKAFLTFRGNRPQQLLRRLPGRRHVRGLDAVESVRRHRGPRPRSRRRHLQHDHPGIRPDLRSNHERPGRARLS
ncbi:hypothetical protein P1P68_01850 [Streptomyces scabiei]|uniref:hypothetical protein n=1 Tax=Streptomyces scabiei TaxID=1930 RepID=UPI00298FF1F3|nr:hypothetical protein [Streptomyces scabiei]MDW8803587.1 hypothetical protein [Streptomyces scabiei]